MSAADSGCAFAPSLCGQIRNSASQTWTFGSPCCSWSMVLRMCAPMFSAAVTLVNQAVRGCNANRPSIVWVVPWEEW